MRRYYKVSSLPYTPSLAFDVFYADSPEEFVEIACNCYDEDDLITEITEAKFWEFHMKHNPEVFDEYPGDESDHADGYAEELEARRIFYC